MKKLLTVLLLSSSLLIVGCGDNPEDIEKEFLLKATDEQKKEVDDVVGFVSVFYNNYFYAKAMCTEEYVKSLRTETSKLFDVLKRAKDLRFGRFARVPLGVRWKTIKDRAWESSKRDEKKWVEENDFMLSRYGALSRRKLREVCLTGIVPEAEKMPRSARNGLLRLLNQQGLIKEKRF